jgi:hypothetical protein
MQEQYNNYYYYYYYYYYSITAQFQALPSSYAVPPHVY